MAGARLGRASFGESYNSEVAGVVCPLTKIMATREILDSLPYYDNDLEKYPALRQKVERELARQPKAPTSIHPNVPPEYELFSASSSSFDDILS